MKSTFRLRKCTNSTKFKVVLFASFLAILIKVFINMVGITELEFALWERKLTRFETSVFYYSLLVLSLVLYFPAFPGRKKWKHIIVIALIPANVWIIFYLLYEEWIYLICGVALFALSIVDVIGLIFTYRDNKKKTGVNPNKILYILQLFSDVIRNSSEIIIYTGLLTVLMVIVTVSPLRNVFSKNQHSYATEKPITYATNMRDLETTTPSFLWEPNKDKLILLSDKLYPQLLFQERVNALQDLVNIECSYLGVVKPCQLVVKELGNYNIAGYYQDSQRIIAIDIALVENGSSLEAIGVLLHECFHCYQADCCRIYMDIAQDGVYEDILNEDLLFFRDCKSWLDDMNHYCSCEDPSDFEDYYMYASQALETSADDYRNEWLFPYWKFINNISEENNVEE